MSLTEAQLTSTMEQMFAHNSESEARVISCAYDTYRFIRKVGLHNRLGGKRITQKRFGMTRVIHG